MIARITIIFILLDLSLKMKSYHPQHNSVRDSLTVGPAENINNFTDDSLGNSFVSNLAASAMG